MIICFKCSHETKEALDNLLEGGEHKDYSEVISVAIANMVVLQAQVDKTGVLVIGEAEQGYRALSDHLREAETSPSRSSPSGRKRHFRLGSTATSRKSGAKGQPARSHVAVPDVFLLDDLQDVQRQVANPPTDIWVIGQEVPLDRWLFGQYNRLLPAKASCRALAHFLKTSPSGVPLRVAAPFIAEKAAILGDFLASHDVQHEIGRDDALSTAFPSIGDNGEKGRLRYANQFVASANSNGQLSGLLIDLKVINYSRRRDPLLQLTEIGWRFATSRNPILDGEQETPTQRFSSEEITFLCKHIANSVPAEDFAYRVILAALADGANTPGTVDAALQRHVPQDRDLSKSFLASQRSGAISRMSDLELVARIRHGVRVSYAITARGQQYADSSSPTSRKGGSRDEQ